eukprot:1156472-Pelagomonas_calceolata.AAC.1
MSHSPIQRFALPNLVQSTFCQGIPQLARNAPLPLPQVFIANLVRSTIAKVFPPPSTVGGLTARRQAGC